MDRPARPFRGLAARWGRLSPFLEGNVGRLLQIGVLSSILGLAEAAALVIIVQGATATADGTDRVDVAAGPVSVDDVALSTLLAVGLILILLVLLGRIATAWLTAVVSSSTAKRLRHRMTGEYLDASWEVQSTDRMGTLQDLLTTHVDRIGQAVLFLGSGLAALASFSTLMMAAVLLDPFVAGVILVGVGVLFVALRPLTAMAKRQSRAHSEAAVSFAGSVSETVLMGLEFRTAGVNDVIRQRLRAAADEVENPYRRQKFLARVLPGVYQNLALIFVLAGLAAVQVLAVDDVASLGAVVLILVRSLTYTQVLQSSFHYLGEVRPYVERVEQSSSRYAGSTTPTGSAALDAVEQIRFDRVSFSYMRGVPALDGVSFAVERGERIGVVGPSGSGKSTLMQILLRLRLPAAGEFLVNGARAADYRARDWHRQFAVVPQEAKLISGSIDENIRFYREHLSDDDVIAAATLAHIHDDIRAWPEAYATRVGEHGGNAVSGGQRQRICLARALATRPGVLLLDEPTSALDLRSEALVEETFEALRGDVTMIVIAHRLSTVRSCDRIMVFNAGRLEAFASPAELEATNVFFTESLQLMQGAAQP